MYRIIFSKPVENELVYEFNIHDLKATDNEHLRYLYMLSKEALSKKGNSLSEYHVQKKLVNPPMLAQIVLSDDVINYIKRAFKKVSIDTKVTNEEIHKMLVADVLKRDALEDEKAQEYRRKILKAIKKKDK